MIFYTKIFWNGAVQYVYEESSTHIWGLRDYGLAPNKALIYLVNVEGGVIDTAQQWSVVSLHRCPQYWRFQRRKSRQIQIHIRKGFSSCIRGPERVEWLKKPEVENLVTQILVFMPHNNIGAVC
jgi:hypothetical protein